MRPRVLTSRVRLLHLLGRLCCSRHCYLHGFVGGHLSSLRSLQRNRHGIQLGSQEGVHRFSRQASRHTISRDRRRRSSLAAVSVLPVADAAVVSASSTPAWQLRLHASVLWSIPADISCSLSSGRSCLLHITSAVPLAASPGDVRSQRATTIASWAVVGENEHPRIQSPSMIRILNLAEIARLLLTETLVLSLVGLP